MERADFNIDEKKLVMKLIDMLFRERFITYTEKVQADRLVRECGKI